MSSSCTLPTSSSTALAGSAPGWENTTTPSRTAIKVGIEESPNACSSVCCASVSTLPKMMSSCCSEACSKTGANIRHGPHHDAQKSISTVPLPPATSSKFCSVSSTVATATSSSYIPLPVYGTPHPATLFPHEHMTWS